MTAAMSPLRPAQIWQRLKTVRLRVLTKTSSHIMVFRCLVWVIAKLTHVCEVQIELTGSMVGYSSEVDEVFKSPEPFVLLAG